MHGFNEVGKAVALTRLFSHWIHLTSVYKLELWKRLKILQLHWTNNTSDLSHGKK